MAANVGESTSGGSNTDAAGGSFECNICFEVPQEPIVTLCGHLFCLPCLYRWLHMGAHTPECPVCKAIVEEDKLVPLYGRGKDRVDPRSKNTPGADIPHRPAGQRPATTQQADPNNNFANAHANPWEWEWAREYHWRMHGGVTMRSRLHLEACSLCLASKCMDFQIQLLMHSLLGFTMGMAMAMDSMAGIWGMPMVSPARDRLDINSRQTST